MSNMLSLLSAMGAPAPASVVYVEDVFGIYTRSGTGASAAVPTGVSLSTLGGLSITKSRSAATDWKWTDTVRGVTKALISDTTGAETTDTNGCTAFSTTGHTVGSDTNYNNSTGPATYVDYDFGQANKFFKVATSTVSGSNTTVDLSSLGTVGMVAVKRTDSTSNWYVWHRSATSGKLLYLNLSDAEATLGHITLSGTTLTLVQSVIGNGTYIVYAWAHDSASTGFIQCGTFTTDGSGNASVTLGWEPQYLMWKPADGTGNWQIGDSSRQFLATGTTSGRLFPNTTSAEVVTSSVNNVSATGFALNLTTVSRVFIYLAIRRGPMKLPTVGTQVYNAIARTGTGAATTVTGVGFPPDLVFTKKRSSTALTGCEFIDRLRGATAYINSTATTAEVSTADTLTAFGMDGFTLDADATTGALNTNTHTYVAECIRRYPGVFDEVCYKGTGSNKTETHNLTVAPELWIVKQRSATTRSWTVGCTALANTEVLILESTAAKATDATAWNSTFPTSTVFSLGTQAAVNTNTSTYVAYLFATLAGISKVGSYSGTNGTQTINCGFTTGARFIMIKRTDSTGDWYIYDTIREGGSFPAGNDMHLSLNTTAAEVATTDDIDADTTGFIVNQNATTNLSATGASYIFLAFA